MECCSGNFNKGAREVEVGPERAGLFDVEEVLDRTSV
jgi:hypothetical protein